MLSRTERFKDLRLQINREIELSQRSDTSKEFLEGIKSNLISIDKNYFKDIIEDLDKKYDWIGTNYDKNVYKESYNENLSYNLQDTLENMNRNFNLKDLNAAKFNLSNKDSYLISYNDSKKILKKTLLSEDIDNDSVFQKYDSLIMKINNNNNLYYRNILNHNNDVETSEIINNEIDIKSINAIREKDKRTLYEMLKEVDSNNISLSNKAALNARKIKKDGKWMFIIFITLFIVSSSMIILAVLL